jgi:hypothetical protein
MDKQEKKELGVVAGALTMIGGLIAIVINASNEDKDKKTT